MDEYPYDIFEDVVATFYVLEATIIELEERKHKDGRFVKLLRQAYQYRKGFHTRLARTMRDSLVGMAFGEARHAKEVARTNITVRPKDGSYEIIRRNRQSRESVYGNLHRFSTTDIIQIKALFDDEGWDGSFGGRAWSELCERAMQYEQLPPTIYCDLVFHVVHNGGCAFSKGLLLSYRENWKVKKCLDMKFEGDVTKCADDIKYSEQKYRLTPTVYKIYEHTRSLIFALEGKIWGSSNFMEGREFKLDTIKWNNKPNLVLEENDDYEYDYDNEEEEEDYYGEEEVEEMVEKGNGGQRDPYTVVSVPRRECVNF